MVFVRKTKCKEIPRALSISSILQITGWLRPPLLYLPLVHLTKTAASAPVIL